MKRIRPMLWTKTQNKTKLPLWLFHHSLPQDTNMSSTSCIPAWWRCWLKGPYGSNMDTCWATEEWILQVRWWVYFVMVKNFKLWGFLNIWMNKVIYDLKNTVNNFYYFKNKCEKAIQLYIEVIFNLEDSVISF